MNTRPKKTDSEQDILEMQRAFLAEKAKNPEFQAAAGFVKIEKAPKKSLFAQTRVKPQTSSAASNDATLPSSVLENFKEMKLEAPEENMIIGDIVEKVVTSPKETEMETTETAFPKVQRITIRKKSGAKSFFTLSLEAKYTCIEEKQETNVDRKRQHDEMMMEVDCEPIVKNPKTGFGESSFIVEEANTASVVHKENLEILSKMKEEEILAERQNILESVDPSLLEFLARKRQQKSAEKHVQPSLPPQMENITSVDKAQLPEGNPAVELLKQSSAEQWIHFDVVEKDKLEWMRDIPQKLTQLKAGESFEARFDWKGVLLPYSEESSETKDDRDLYLHGDEPFRPGYTLQELFRLARSSVIQQRVSAFTSIGGILSIYNQGFYDDVLELPIAKIFFLLRFGLDENTPAILEVVSKALAILLYNETDESLLDAIFENKDCHWQPILEVNTIDESDDPTSIKNLQKQMQSLKVSSSIKANVQETEEESKVSMTDFQLAETDLIAFLLRSNIIQRIYFILNSVKPENSTVFSCLKILIRIARTNEYSARQILHSEDLMNCLFTNFLPRLQSVDTTSVNPPFYNYPQYLGLKLCRVLMSHSLTFTLKLLSLPIVDRIKNYVHYEAAIKGNLIKVQIESMRIFRFVMLLQPNSISYWQFTSAFLYMIHWHYNHLVYEKGGPHLIRQHASALVCALGCAPKGSEVWTTFLNCVSNWFYRATKHGVEEFSQSTLLTSCLCAVARLNRSNEGSFRNFIGIYLKNFLESESFLRFETFLNCTSILLCSKDVIDRRNIFPALPNMGAILMKNNGPQLAIPPTYCVYFLASLWELVERRQETINKTVLNCLIQVRTIEPFVEFLKNLSNGINAHLTTNFFAKRELKLIFNLLQFDGFKEYLAKSAMLPTVYNFVCCLSAEYIDEIRWLFDRVIFKREYLGVEDQNKLNQWAHMFKLDLFPQHKPNTEFSLSKPSSGTPVLARDWPYCQLKIILQNYVRNVHQKPVRFVSEREAIRITLTLTSCLESASFQVTTPTEKLMYLMVAFMGPDSQFLDPTVKALLKDHIVNFYRSCTDFEFDGAFEGKCKFENLYALFVDHFQAASYGDDLFSSLVLVPLAQKYDNKWRRMIWSEHASVLRFLNCDESLLLGGLDAYLNPPEDEESLIKCYAGALQTNLLRPNTIVYKIAQHHVDKFKEMHL